MNTTTTTTAERLGPLAATALIPLVARASDARQRYPILSDRTSAAVANRLDLGRAVAAVDDSTRVGCCLRGLVIDTWLAQLAESAGGQLAAVVDLGVGLNTRSHRLAGIAERYVEVDSGEVIALRDQLLPVTSSTRLATDAMHVLGWASHVAPTCGPVAVVCEALLAYQTPERVQSFLDDLSCLLPQAHVLFDSMSPAAAWLANRPAVRAGGRPRYTWATRSTGRLRSAGRPLRIVAETTLLRQPRQWTSLFPAKERLLFALPGLRGAFRITHAQLQNPGAAK
ncbi:hypothetical protein [Pilimelia columellifera]|uniref:Class I SAM-dependent methyltransferase n=1 Tax=Pilimelia columellifera subsp. columellifera TaxID=706583 RepID=A0ABP6ATP2_9ACTN